MAKQIVVRTKIGFSPKNLEEKLEEGWVIKFATALSATDRLGFIEYILEKEVNK